jgi:hypothetical protein
MKAGLKSARWAMSVGLVAWGLVAWFAGASALEAVVFEDVPSGHWAYSYITALAQDGFIAGCATNPSRFCPEAMTNRAEMAVFVERGDHGGGFEPAEPTQQVFADVAPGAWYAKWVTALWQDAYTAGCGTNPLMYCPEAGHTRAEAAVFFVRLRLGKDYQPPAATTTGYDDVPVGASQPWYSKWIAAAVKEGIVQACEDDANRGDRRYRPTEGLTRAEGACMLYLAKGVTEPTPTPPPPGGSTRGFWITREEIQNLPISGQSGCGSGTLCSDAWNDLLAKAKGSWGTPNLTTYDLPHPPGVLAAALVATRLETEPGKSAEAQELRNKAIQGMLAVMGTEQAAVPRPDGSGGKDDGSLAISRNLGFYVIAADILGVYPDGNASSPGTRWGNYVAYMAQERFTFRAGDGGKTLSQSHDQAASNGNAMAGGARIAVAAYLGNEAELDRAWLTFRRYTGDRSVGPDLDFNSYGVTWRHNLDQAVGINPVGAICNGSPNYPADGVLPNDQGRGGDCPNDPSQAPGYTQYPWEGLQGAFMQAMMLKRLGYRDPSGKDPFHTNNSALLRAAQYQWYLQTQFGGSWYDASRAAWVKHLLNREYGYEPRSYSAVSGGRNMNYTQWTHP